MAQSVGSPTLELFEQQGDGHVEVLRFHGLTDGMSIYDLGCGCGRTAQALQRSGWTGTYAGADIVKSLVKHVLDKCPGYDAFLHRELSIRSEDASLDMVFHWSVFTHLFPEECFIYMREIYRALRPGGKMIFSFLEIEDPAHWVVLDARVNALSSHIPLEHLDTFLHRDWIKAWADKLGYCNVTFTDGFDGSHHAPFWQSLASMEKPL
jgi:SAM-dependent methyltransferase